MTHEPQQEGPTGPDPLQTTYFNGFSMAIGMGDVVIALQLNGRPTLLLNTSYTVAKTMAEGLATLIGELEHKTGTTIMTTQVVAAALTRDPEQDPS